MIQAVDREREVRLVVARTTRLVQEIADRHDMSATARAAIGRLVTGALMMTAGLKAENSVTIRVNGGGPVGVMVAVAEAEGTARGFVENPWADVPSARPGKLDVGRLVGTDGDLEVVKDLGLAHPFTGSVALQTGEIGDDLAYYYLVSEQIPSLVGVGVLVDTDLTVKAAGGLLIQALPGASDEKLALCEENTRAMGAVSDAILHYDNIADILGLVLGPDGFEVLKETDLSFSCRCSRERVAAIIAAMSEEDVRASLAELGHVEARCNFCNEVYVFSPAEIDNIKKGRPE